MENEKSISVQLCRHGKAAHNIGGEQEHKFAGSGVDNELVEEGIENAKVLAQKIEEAGGCDYIIASHLLRSRQTAEIISEILDKPVEIIESLAEINVGDFAGMTEAEVKEKFPAEAESFYSGNVPNWNFPNGEDFSSADARVDNLISEIKERIPAGSKIAIVGHAGINRVLLYKLLPNEEKLWKERSYPHDRIVEIEI